MPSPPAIPSGTLRGSKTIPSTNRFKPGAGSFNRARKKQHSSTRSITEINRESRIMSNESNVPVMPAGIAVFFKKPPLLVTESRQDYDAFFTLLSKPSFR